MEKNVLSFCHQGHPQDSGMTGEDKSYSIGCHSTQQKSGALLG